jgi:hypothetical protein
LDGPDSAFGSFVRPTLLADSLKSTIDSIIPESIVADIIRSLGAVGGGVFEFLLEPAIQPAGQITWSTEVYGPNGVTWDGVAVQVDPNNNQHVYVSVDPSVAGDVVLFATYVDTNGALVTAQPVVVLSRPPGAVENGIELRPSSATLAPGAKVPLTIWLDYTNGASSLPFVGPGQGATFSSSSPSVVSVDTNGVATARDYGAATLAALYHGFLAQASYSVLPPSGRPVLMNPKVRSNGAFEFTVVGATGRNYLVQATTNLVIWTALTNVTSVEVLTPVVDVSATSGQTRFYRAVRE